LILTVQENAAIQVLFDGFRVNCVLKNS